MINVTKAYLPSYERYQSYLHKVWGNNWLTNNGPLVQELEKKLVQKLEVPYLQYVSNGTIAIQLAMRALELKGEIITTPYSYVATCNAVLWENCSPVFCDIEKECFGIDPNYIEALITKKTTAILATHVYGFPCKVKEIEEIASKHGLRVIYDAAHAFGIKYLEKPLVGYGDISTLSFHATKIFHTVEGGGIVLNEEGLNEKIFLLKSFGHRNDNYFNVGTNAKNSEFHAAMGLCVLEDFDKIKLRRKEISSWYGSLLDRENVDLPEIPAGLDYNYSYYPVFFKNEPTMLEVIKALGQNEIFPRRYFYPSLNTLPFISNRYSCPVSEDLASRVLCLPLYYDLHQADVERISSIVNQTVKE